MRLIHFITLLSLSKYCASYFVSIDAHEEECFLERVKKGVKLGLAFEVVEGGFLDIDINIYAPDGETIHNGERESNGRYTFPAAKDGLYKYCFSNKMSTMTPKVVMFSMDVGDSAEKPEHQERTDEEKKENGEGGDNKLEEMIKELSAALSGVKHEQDYMEVRERVHRSINDNTNSRVVLWSVFEAVVLLSMTLGQVYYLKQFFEVRRVV